MKYLIFFLFNLLPILLFSQVKYDNNWFVATQSGSNPDYGLTRIDFTENPPLAEKISGYNVSLNMSNSSWSDALGTFRYFTNGCQIISSGYTVMENGDSINPGRIHDDFCLYGYLIPQGTMILPKVETDTIQYLFHLWSDDFPLWGVASLKLLYSEINSNSNGGLGKVIQKNQVLLEDTLAFGQFTAVKHANGNDWWLIMPENSSNGYYILSLDENGPALSHQQNVGKVQDGRDWGGQAVFSPDGRFYVRAEAHSGMEIFEFDRCRGKLYNNRHIELPFDENSPLGVAISPNSRYLYVSSNIVLVQYDLFANDIAASVDTVGIYDGFQSWLPTTFYLMQLAPNGKIYMTTGNGTNVMHIIQQPDLPSTACQFEQHAFQLPRYYGFAPPNLPNYRLGSVPEGYCDSLLLSVKSPQNASAELKTYPNPAQDVVTLAWPKDKICQNVTVLDMLGQVVYRMHPSAEETSIQIRTSGWAGSVYYIFAEFEHQQHISNTVLILSH